MEGQRLSRRPALDGPGPTPAGPVVVADLHALFVARGTHPARRVTPPPTRSGTAYLLSLFLLWVLNLIDLALTVHWTGQVGWGAEGNLKMRSIALLFGPLGFIVYKTLLMTIVVLVLWWLYRRFETEALRVRKNWQLVALDWMRRLGVTLTLVLIGFYVWVLANNLRIIGPLT